MLRPFLTRWPKSAYSPLAASVLPNGNFRENSDHRYRFYRESAACWGVCPCQLENADTLANGRTLGFLYRPIVDLNHGISPTWLSKLYIRRSDNLRAFCFLYRRGRHESIHS